MHHTFTLGYDFVERWEGYYSNDKDDPGLETLFGISRKYWPKWEAWAAWDALKEQYGGIPSKDVAESHLQGYILDFYRKYWEKAGCNYLPVGCDIYAFDMAVNQGTIKTRKAVQYAVGAKEDSIIGPNTRALIAATIPEVMLKRLNARRNYEYMIGGTEKSRKKYGHGWSNRATDCLYEAQDILE